MRKKKSATLIVILVVLSFMIYWFYFSKPSTFPVNERLVREINHLFPEADAQMIRETISIDDRHVVVPFISNQDGYGLSYWVWKNHKWKVAMVDTKGQPKLWKINRKDPSSYYFVWNIHPKDQLNSIHFYLIRNRGYQVTDGNENYIPRVQMEKRVSLQKKTYGVLRMPDEWSRFMDSVMKVESANQSNLLSQNMFSEHDMYFGWISYDQSGKETYPEHSVNGSRYSDINLNIDYLQILNSGELD